MKYTPLLTKVHQGHWYFMRMVVTGWKAGTHITIHVCSTEDDGTQIVTVHVHNVSALSKSYHSWYTCVDSKGNPRCITNSKGRKRKPGSRELASAIKTTDPSFLDFIRRCLEWDQAARMTPEEALQHQWILEVCWICCVKCNNYVCSPPTLGVHLYWVTGISSINGSDYILPHCHVCFECSSADMLVYIGPLCT